MELAIHRHGAPHRALTRGRVLALVLQHAMNPKPAGTGILALQVQNLFEKRQAELITRMRRRPRPVVFKTRKSIAFECL